MTDQVAWTTRQLSGKKKCILEQECGFLCPCLPGRVILGCRGGPCPVLLFSCLRDLGSNGPVFSFTFSPAQWALLQLNEPVQLYSLVDKTVN